MPLISIKKLIFSNKLSPNDHREMNLPENKVLTSSLVCCGRAYTIQHKNKQISALRNYAALTVFLIRHVYDTLNYFIGNVSNFMDKTHYVIPFMSIFVINLAEVMLIIILFAIELAEMYYGEKKEFTKISKFLTFYSASLQIMLGYTVLHYVIFGILLAIQRMTKKIVEISRSVEVVVIDADH